MHTTCFPAKLLQKNKRIITVADSGATLEYEKLLGQADQCVEQMVFIMEQGVQATINDQFFSHSFADAVLFRSIIFILRPGAQLIYKLKQELGMASSSSTNISVFAHENTIFDGWLVDAGSAHRKWWLTAQMIGEHADVSFRHACFARGGRSDIISLQQHVAPTARSRVMVKGLVSGSGQMHFDGMIEIAKLAVATDADLQHAALLLSDQARATAQPALEVLTSDISCQHGSAIGHLHPDELWYLQARGISEKKAQDLLVNAFMKEVLPL